MVGAQSGGTDEVAVGSNSNQKGECRMISPTEWIESHWKRIEEARCRLAWETDPEKRKTLHEEISWREEEITFLKKKLAS